MRNTVFHVSPKLAMYSNAAKTATVSDTRVMTVPFLLLFLVCMYLFYITNFLTTKITPFVYADATCRVSTYCMA